MKRIEKMESCIEQLKEFLAGPLHNVWLGDSHLQVYVRKGRRYLEGDKLIHMLDIANISATEPGKGIGTAFIREAHVINPFSITYIESILNDQFLDHLLREGWILAERCNPPCVYLKKTSS